MSVAVQQQIDAARRRADGLREQIWKKKDALNDGSLAEIAKTTPPVIRDPPVRLRRSLRGHLGKVYALQWSGDSRHIVSASQDGRLIVWDTYTTNKAHAIPLKSAWVMTCAFSPSGSFVASGGLNNICSVHSLRAENGNGTARGLRELSGHTGFLSCCRFVNDRQILTSSGDTTCALWDIESTRAIAVFQGHVGDVMRAQRSMRGSARSVSLHPTQPNLFVSGGCDTLAKVWDVRVRKCIQTFAGHENDINGVQFLPSGDGFGTASDDGTCRIFDLRSDREMAQFADDSVGCGVTSLAFSASSRLLFAGYDDGQCIGWDTLLRRPAVQLTGHENRVTCVGVAPDGTAVCTASWDTVLRVFA